MPFATGGHIAHARRPYPKTVHLRGDDHHEFRRLVAGRTIWAHDVFCPERDRQHRGRLRRLANPSGAVLLTTRNTQPILRPGSPTERMRHLGICMEGRWAAEDRGWLRVCLSARRRAALSKMRKHRADTLAAEPSAAKALVARARIRSCNKRAKTPAEKLGRGPRHTARSAAPANHPWRSAPPGADRRAGPPPACAPSPGPPRASPTPPANGR